MSEKGIRRLYISVLESCASAAAVLVLDLEVLWPSILQAVCIDPTC